jgi:hypothetical protein
MAGAQQRIHRMRADETGAAGDEDFHTQTLFNASFSPGQAGAL